MTLSMELYYEFSMQFFTQIFYGAYGMISSEGFHNFHFQAFLINFGSRVKPTCTRKHTDWSE